MPPHCALHCAENGKNAQTMVPESRSRTFIHVRGYGGFVRGLTFGKLTIIAPLSSRNTVL